MDCPALAEAPKEHGKAFAGPNSGEDAIDCNSPRSHERYAAGVGCEFQFKPLLGVE